MVPYVLLADRRPLRPDLIRAIEEYALVRCLEDLDPSEAPAVLAETAVIMSGRRPVSDTLQSAAGQLRGIVAYGAGYEHVDVAAASERGVMVTYTPGVNAVAAAELALGLTILLARRAHVPTQSACASESIGTELSGKTLGLVGLGQIGSLLAKMARGFGMDVVATVLRPSAARAVQHGVTLVPMAETLRRADFVIVCCALTAGTRGLIGADELALMKASAYIINVARGGIVDEAALNSCLRARRIAGAATDVLVVEPPGDALPFDCQSDNLLITPHLGGRTDEASERLQEVAAAEICRILRGEVPEHLVNPRVLQMDGREANAPDSMH